MALPFWKTKKLSEMTPAEWESLCDGCGKCCLFKLEDEDDGKVYYTNIVCKLIDLKTCRCTRYDQRTELVPTCLELNSENVFQLTWMPKTCAYRLLAEGKDLYWWHHLVSGSFETVHKVGVSIRGKVEMEDTIPEEDWEDHVVDWFNE